MVVTKNRFKSRGSQMFLKLGVLKNFANFTGKMCVGVSRHTTLLKKRLHPMFFPVDSVKILRKPFLQNIFGRLIRVNEYFYLGVSWGQKFYLMQHFANKLSTPPRL